MYFDWIVSRGIILHSEMTETYFLMTNMWDRINKFFKDLYSVT